MARLLFFGRLGDMAGGRERAASLPSGVASVNALIDAIAAEEKELGAALKENAVRIAVNETISGRDAGISDSDEIAFLPPVSGG